MRDLAAETGVAMTMGIIATNPGGYEMLELIDSVAAVGGRMIGQSHSRGINVLLSFATRLPFDLLPAWHDVRALPDDEQLRALRDPSVRERLISTLGARPGASFSVRRTRSSARRAASVAPASSPRAC